MRCSSARLLSDALRRLLVVIGCAVLATAQPMSALAAPTSVQAPDTVIYPKDSAERPAPTGTSPARSGFAGQMGLVLAVLLAAGGGWLLVKRRTGGPLLGGRSTHKLTIEETRSLGNRQYLVVAAYENQKFLLGVTPGQIQMLVPLQGPEGKA